MSDSWIVFYTDSFEKKAEQFPIGSLNSEDEAKTFAKTFGEKVLSGHSIAEINGEWCVQGSVGETMTYIRYRRGTEDDRK